MSGDWLKMRVNLQTHPKVVRILSALKTDKFRVIGGLHAVWAVFDQHSDDGRLSGYTLETMDHIIGWRGFSRAMQAVNWLVETDDGGLIVPEFDEHNGQSAKRRAEDTKRKKASRKCPQNVRTLSDDVDDNEATHGGPEKRREEKKKEKTPVVPFAGDPMMAAVIDAYHVALPNCQRVAALTPKRVKRIRLANRMASDLCRQQGWEFDCAGFWAAYFAECQQDPWLRGDVPNPKNPRWKQKLDVLLADDRFAQIMDSAIASMRDAA